MTEPTGTTKTSPYVQGGNAASVSSGQLDAGNMEVTLLTDGIPMGTLNVDPDLATKWNINYWVPPTGSPQLQPTAQFFISGAMKQNDTTKAWYATMAIIAQNGQKVGKVKTGVYMDVTLEEALERGAQVPAEGAAYFKANHAALATKYPNAIVKPSNPATAD